MDRFGESGMWNPASETWKADIDTGFVANLLLEENVPTTLKIAGSEAFNYLVSIQKWLYLPPPKLQTPILHLDPKSCPGNLTERKNSLLFCVHQWNCCFWWCMSDRGQRYSVMPALPCLVDQFSLYGLIEKRPAMTNNDCHCTSTGIVHRIVTTDEVLKSQES